MRKVSNWCSLCNICIWIFQKFPEKTFIDKGGDLELCINYILKKQKKWYRWDTVWRYSLIWGLNTSHYKNWFLPKRTSIGKSIKIRKVNDISQLCLAVISRNTTTTEKLYIQIHTDLALLIIDYTFTWFVSQIFSVTVQKKKVGISVYTVQVRRKVSP